VRNFFEGTGWVAAGVPGEIVEKAMGEKKEAVVGTGVQKWPGSSGQVDTEHWVPIEWISSLKELTQHINLHFLLMPVLLGFAMLFLMMSSITDWVRRMRGQGAVAAGGPGAVALQAPGATKPALHEWSKLAIFAVTSFRFYTGFLSATWMPYLLAMEGHQLMGERQSVFMGSAKLIYGMTIMLNPMFGLVGDQLAVVSHWSGRRLFVLVGVGSAGLGIYGCVVAAQLESTPWYLVATVLWMLGEAMADVTTEAVVPELIPRSQYEVASAIRAQNFLLGGLVGYVALIVFRSFHYSWIYYGYLIVMLVCAFLTLSFIDAGDLAGQQRDRDEEVSLSAFLTQAYYMPSRIQGGFPKACLCMFVFSSGSAPMFFLLLMVRDIVGIKDPTDLQIQFSAISIVFFISAAASTVLGAILAGPSSGTTSSDTTQGANATEAEEQDTQRRAERDQIRSRWWLMVMSTLCFAMVITIIPFLGLISGLHNRTVGFYIFAIAFGFGFGSVYARFQECTWSLLPKGIDVANAMGWAAMCKNAGIGLGNFFVGFILDYFRDGPKAYSLPGYFVMCAFCCFVVFLTAFLAHQIGNQVLKDHDSKLPALAQQ